MIVDPLYPGEIIGLLFEKLLAADNVRTDVCHVPEITLLNLFSDGRSAVTQNRNFIIQRDSIITGCADAVWCGCSGQNDMPYTFAAQNQIEPGAEKGGVTGLDKQKISVANTEHFRHGRGNRFFTAGR